MSELTSALERISAWYQAHESRSVFRPGLHHADIDEIVKDLQFSIPNEVYELYKWCDGTSENDRVAFHQFYLLPLAGAVRLRQRPCGLNEGSEPIPDDPRWLPIFELWYGGAFYVVVLGDNGKSPVRLYDTEFGKYELYYESLTNMLLHCAEWLQLAQCDEKGENWDLDGKIDTELQVKYMVKSSNYTKSAN
jgi:SMI1 / KNR4 family (SUKH-1)